MQHPELTAERRAELVKLAEAVASDALSSPSEIRRAKVTLAYEAALKAKEEEALKLREALQHHFDQDIPFADRQALARAALSPETSNTNGER